MDKQVLKRIITERHQEVRERQLTFRPQQFEERMNYVLVGIRRAGKSCLMIQDMQPRIVEQKFDNTCQIRLGIRRSMASELESRLKKLSFE